MGIVKVHRYGVRSHSLGERLLALEAPGKPTLQVATPPDFKDGIPDVWSPEELLTGALATCYELTLVAIAERRELPMSAIKVDATGHVERKHERYCFILFELEVELETDALHTHEVEELAHLAKERCIVGSALGVPVHLSLRTRVAGEHVAAA